MTLGRLAVDDDGGGDAVLLFGPLYHLTKRADRVGVRCSEAVSCGSTRADSCSSLAISRFASLLDGLSREFLFDAPLPIDRRAGLATTVSIATRSETPHWFTTAYFHHPADLPGEAATSRGWTVFEVVGVEGVAGWFHAISQIAGTTLFSGRRSSSPREPPSPSLP